MNYNKFVENLEYFRYRKSSYTIKTLGDDNKQSYPMTFINWENFTQQKDGSYKDIHIKYVISNNIIRQQFSSEPNIVEIRIRTIKGTSFDFSELSDDVIKLGYDECIKLIIEQELADMNILRDMKLNVLLK